MSKRTSIARLIPAGAFLAIAAVLVVSLTAVARPSPRFVLAQGGDLCGGIPCPLACTGGQVCVCEFVGGVYTWTCGWANPPQPLPTAIPRPTQPPLPTNTPGGPTPTPRPTQPPTTPTPTPCLDRFEIHVCEVALGCPPAYGRDVTYVYDCITGLLIGRYQGECHVCWGTPTPTRTPPPTSIAPTPVCQYQRGPGGRVIIPPECIAQVQAVIPCIRVYRTPYPRSLVGDETAFLVDPDGPNKAEFWSNQLPEGVPDDLTTCMRQQHWRYRNYQLGLKWVRIDSPDWDYAVGVPGPYPPQPTWNFDERAWNIESNFASGEQVQHTYQTSSWGKPHNGPEGLPAYQVRFNTYWALFWAVQYDEWECVRRDEECDCRPGRGDHYAAWCPDCDDGSYNSRWVCVECDWVHKFKGWYVVDLREEGAPNWYESSVKVAIPQQGLGCSSVIPVPVIEVQSVIER